MDLGRVEGAEGGMMKGVGGREDMGVGRRRWKKLAGDGGRREMKMGGGGGGKWKEVERGN